MTTPTALSTEEILRASAAAGARPDPFLTISEWADKYRWLSQRASAEPGQWRTDRTPYLREIMDCLSPASPVERTVFMKGAQIGGTECGNLALKPFAGQFASLLFGIGLINASLLSAAILPLATAYNVCEALGFESGVDKRFSEAKIFYSLYTFLIVLGAGCVLIPKMPLFKVVLLSQVANGVLIPFVLIFMLKLINRESLMGDMLNGTTANVIAVSTTVVMIVLTAMMLWTSVIG